MTAINVDDFCKDAARTLLVLYQAFPRPHTVFVEDLVGPDQVDEFGMHSERHLACFSALLWLADEGLLRYVDTIRQEAVDQAVLTGRAFTLLATPQPDFAAGSIAAADGDGLPESLRLEQQTHQHRLEQALKRRSSRDIRAAVLSLLGAIQGAVPRAQPELATR